MTKAERIKRRRVIDPTAVCPTCKRRVTVLDFEKGSLAMHGGIVNGMTRFCPTRNFKVSK